MISRREFITLVGGAAAWPLAVGAQQRERIRHVSVLLPALSDSTDFQAWVGAFLQGLAQFGWIIGRNVQIDTSWAGAKADDIRRRAQELVALVPDVILAHGASNGPAAAVDPQHTDSVSDHHRSSRRRVRRELGAPRRQRDRVHVP
jgi:putative ABC transport system substrate-binding protein